MDTYFDPEAPGSFGGVEALYRACNKEKTRGEIRDWLSDQPAYTLHKPLRFKFKRNVIMVHNINEQFQADLVDMSMYARQNGGVHFLLTCIDVFSKYAWVIPMKNKSAKSTAQAFRQIFAEQIPSKLQTDRGKEFENSDVKTVTTELGINHFFAWNPEIKCSIVERFNRTLKNKMWRYLTHNNKTKRYIDVLPSLVKSYNNTYHRSIKMTPIQVTSVNVKEVWNNLYGHIGPKPRS